MNFSPHQLAFFEELRSGRSSIILNAVAGSGKTTTIVEAARNHVSPSVLTTFLAFNKNIAEELQTRVPRHVAVGTFHSACFRALQRTLPRRPSVSKDKIRDILKENLKWKDQELYLTFATRLVSYAKSAGVGIPSLPEFSFATFESLVAHFSMTLDSLDADLSRAISIAMDAFEQSNSELSVVDFDDMLYLALAKRVRFDVSSFVFVDEAQDTNAVQRELLKLMGRFEGPTPLSRLIAVGDPKQAIYGFRGADSSALAAIARDFNAKELPLSTCYRCSQAVIGEVWKEFPELKPSTLCASLTT